MKDVKIVKIVLNVNGAKKVNIWRDAIHAKIVTYYMIVITVNNV